MKRKFVLRAVCPAVLLLLAAGCVDSPPSGQKNLDVISEMPALETRIYVLIDHERHRLDPKAQNLTLDPELVRIARQRSLAMATKGSFSVGKDPHASATMLMEDDARFQGLIGENVAAQSYSAAAGIDVDTYAKRFVDSWLASKPHEENLSFADYNHTGVGAAVNGNTVYVTQLFTSDLGLGPHKNGAPQRSAERVSSPKRAKEDSETVSLRGTLASGPPP